MLEWLIKNRVELLSAVCGIGGLWLALLAFLKDIKVRQEETKARKLSNLLAITANFREVWKDYFLFPDLARVLDPAADMEKQPLTPREELFVGMVISQMGTVYYSMKDELLHQQEGSRRDIAQFLSKPVPHAVWSKTKPLQNQDFAAFVESALKQN